MKIFNTAIALLTLGNLTAQTVSFTPIQNPSFATFGMETKQLADVDNDGDLDLFATGMDTLYNKHSFVYFNDGTGHFTTSSDTVFSNVDRSDAVFGDVNNDGYKDLLLIGFDDSYTKIANLYLNDGTGHFQQDTTVPFLGVHQGSIGLADFDLDNDQDVIISGNDFNGNPNTRLYRNDGNGGFSLIPNTTIDSVHYSSLDFADIDNDNDQDLVISGINTQGNIITKLFLNDGNGVFTFDNSNDFVGIYFGKVTFFDYNNDNSSDLLVVGDTNGIGGIASLLYVNDGNGNFSLVSNTPFFGAKFSNVAVGDITNNGFNDVFIAGDTTLNGDYNVQLFLNNNGNYNLLSPYPFANINYSSAIFGDIDNDGDLDAVVSGAGSNYNPQTQVYINNLITAGITNKKNEKQLFIYPNPATNFTNIDFSLFQDSFDVVTISIFSLEGKLVLKQKVRPQKHTLQIDNLSQGTYIISVKNTKQEIKGILFKL